MRLIFLIFGLILTCSVFSQKRIHAGAWCAKGKTPIRENATVFPIDSNYYGEYDIIHTELNLEIKNYVQNSELLAGYADVYFKVVCNTCHALCLDFLMAADSVQLFRGPDFTPYPIFAWYVLNNRLNIDFPFFPGDPIKGDTMMARIFYRAGAYQDASGWGGLYVENTSPKYAFNLGVGFAADPHSFGRRWMPCYDIFTERSTYKFVMTSPTNRPTYCNGTLTEEISLPGDRIRRTWEINEPIPAYLAGFASGPYSTYKNQFTGETGPVPVEIAVAPADSNKLKASFQHLPDALAAFEHWYGPYRWNKIGYSIVPFNQGAMEHATNIAYMQPAVDGSLNWETLMAHELSHQWWGNLATCSTEEDMWLNEGLASYSEQIFLEWVYGPERYQQEVERNFLSVLENTHVAEGGYRAVSGLPHSLTYGSHVYDKGAVIPHNLRGYLGDSLFRNGLRAVLEKQQFSDWSSADLRDSLSAATNYDLTDFFDDWVYQPGFADFSIDSVQLQFSPVDLPTRIFLFVKQKLRGATKFYQNVPLEFTVVNPFGNREYRTAMVSGENSMVEIAVPAWFFPEKIWVNTRQKHTFARAAKELTAKSTGTYNFSPARMIINVKNLPADSALIRVEHHYAMPDTAGFANPHQFQLSNRYWKVDALNTFEGEATLFYDGKGQLDQLDTELFALTGPKEDSVILAYRPGPGHPWQEHPNYTKNPIGSTQDRYGILRPLHLPPGEYTIAKGATTVSTQTPITKTITTRVSPNPAKRHITIQAEFPFEQITIFNSAGELIADQKQAASRALTIETATWAAGTYWALLVGKDASGIAGPFVIQK